jgi:DNA polymerase III delta subunit
VIDVSQPRPWLDARFALLHGEDSDGRSAAVEAWKAVHVDPEWEVFSFTVCAEGCAWPEVLNALRESAPLGADRVVLVPQADNLLEKAKELPPAVKQMLNEPLPGTRLLLVARGTLSAGPGKILGAKPFSEWNQQGRVLKVGALEAKEAAAWIESAAAGMKLRLESGVAGRIAARLGGNPGILRRTLEVLELLATDRAVSLDLVDQATFRLGEQNVFAWTKAWQGGQIAPALQALRLALEDDPSSGGPLALLGQARREVERLCRLAEARRLGLKGGPELVAALGLSPRQGFLLDGYVRVLGRIGAEGSGRLLSLVNQTDLDLKGQAISRSATPLLNLTTALCRAWGS